MNEEELNELKYRQLQKLAKDHGVKANLPKAAIISAILEAIANGNQDAGKEKTVDSSDENDASESSETEPEVMDTTVKEAEKVKTPKSSNNSTKNDSSVELLFVDEPSDDKSSEKKVESELQKRNSLASLPASRRNSRISRLFDKEAFDIEAAKVSRLAQKVLDSPRRRSSILNLTPVGKNQTASAINSPLVNPTPKAEMKKIKSGPVDSPLAKPIENLQNVLSPQVKSSLKSTPLNKRPSLSKTATKNTTAKKVTLKANLVKTPGSITKAKDRLPTGIPRPRKVPDFAKMHAKQFSKMDTLGEYLDKKKERMAALTPGAKKQPPTNTKPASVQQPPVRKSPRNLNFVTDIAKTSFNFTKKDTTTTNQTASKPFVFSATKKPEPLDNITNKDDAKYKPKLGKLKPWNPKESQLERQKMANRALAGEGVKKKQLSVIKGVRLNKRTELMLQKRRINQ